MSNGLNVANDDDIDLEGSGLALAPSGVSGPGTGPSRWDVTPDQQAKINAAQKMINKLNTAQGKMVVGSSALGPKPSYASMITGTATDNLTSDIGAAQDRRNTNGLSVKNKYAAKKTARALMSRKLTGRKGLRLLDQENSLVLSKRAKKLAEGRSAASAVTSMGVSLSSTQDSYLKSISELAKTTPAVAIAYGLTNEGIQKRREAAAGNFQPSSGRGKFNAYYIANGVVRGGFTARGRENGDGTYSIPVRAGNDKRVLQSLQAKYTHPMAFPSTRIVKFIRGHWGNPAGGKWKDESLWVPGQKRSKLSLE